MAGLAALLMWALVVIGKYGGNPTGLARIGEQITLSPQLQRQELVVLQGMRGHDGQHSWRWPWNPCRLIQAPVLPWTRPFTSTSGCSIP